LFFVFAIFAFCTFVYVMAVTVSEEKRAEVLASAGADLWFLFDRQGVDVEFALKLYSIGITTVQLFAVFAKDQSDLEALLKAHFDIDPENIVSRVRISKIVVAWLAAKTRAQKQSEQDGDCEVRRIPKDIPLASVAAMGTAFEKTYWALEEGHLPARSYLERKLDEIEKDDLRAEPLEEVVSMTEDDPDALKTEWKPDGQLRAVRIGTKVSLPKGPEDLRKRLALLGTTLIFTSLQQVHKAYLKGLTPQTFVDYVEYLLGDYVWKLAAHGAGGTLLSSPSWSLLLSYEHAIRKKMVSLVKKGQTVKDALRAAMEDPVTKERFFTTPLCVEAVSGKRAAPSEWAYSAAASSSQAPNRNGSGNSRGNKGKKGKGNGKSNKDRLRRSGNTKGAPTGCASKTPDGTPICFRFNGGGCSTPSCPFVHACGKCFAAGVPMTRCKRCGTGPM
jgi:hypothetical protein